MPHIHNKIDFTVEVFVVHNDRVLLRKHDKYNIQLSVGGHIELDEDPNQSAVREVREEVGLEIKLKENVFPFPGEGPDYAELIPPVFLNRHRVNETHEHVTLVYFASAQTDNLRPSKQEKSDKLKWFTREEIEENSHGIRESIRYYALKALDAYKNNLKK